MPVPPIKAKEAATMGIQGRNLMLASLPFSVHVGGPEEVVHFALRHITIDRPKLSKVLDAAFVDRGEA